MQAQTKDPLSIKAKLEIKLRAPTPDEWVMTVLSDFNRFLADHAACERKASATGINFVVRYPDRKALIEPMIRFAREELLHFQQVCGLALSRDVSLQGDEKDPYVNEILSYIRHGRDERFLDRLLAFAIIEARGCERLKILEEKLEDPELREFYSKLREAESRHQSFFIEIAQMYFSDESIQIRLIELEKWESQAMLNTEIRAAFH